MNVTTLQQPPQTQAARKHTEATNKDLEFISLRLLNKRARLRLSPEPLDLNAFDGKGTFLALANLKGWFAAVTRSGDTHHIMLSPLADLRSTLTSSTADQGEIPFTPQRIISMAPATPIHLTFACNDGRLIVGLAQGPVLVYDTAQLFSSGSADVPPLHSFPSTNAGQIRQILSNPGDLPDLVAVRRESDGNTGGQPVEVLDARKLQSVGGWRNGNTPDTTPTSITWSAKGKQLAVGLQSGDILTFSPTETSVAKLHVPRPPQADGQSLIATAWLSNPGFLTIYAPPGPLQPDAPQKHFLLLHDAKSNSTADVEFSPPCWPSPGLRPPGTFAVVLRNWNPLKFLLFLGDAPSSDIGVLGCVANASGEETWCNVSLEETSTPGLPLDKDTNETVLLGLELDLTNKTPLKSGSEGPEFAPPPVMILYASDGTIQAWYITNSEGGSYPGMITGDASSTAVPTTTIPTTIIPTTPKTSFTSPTFSSPTRSPFAQTTPTFGAPAFGFQQPTTSPFAQQQQQQPAQISVFSQPSGFGTSPFSQHSGSTFGQSSFGQAAPATTGGFGAYASQAPSKFGSTGFGFSNPQPSASPMALAPSATMADGTGTPSTEMADADTTGGFGGLSLGGGESDTAKGKAEGNGNGMFGSFGQPTGGTQQGSTFGSTAFAGGGGLVVKPAAGFGAFASLQTQPAPSTSTGDQSAKHEPTEPSLAFGTSAFGTRPQAAFGQSTFGQSGFGQSGFGSSGAAGATGAFGSAKGGGFGAFAQGATTGFAGFAAAGQQTLASASQTASGNVFGGQPTVSAFGAGSGNALGGPQKLTAFATGESSTSFGTQQQDAAVKTSIFGIGSGTSGQGASTDEFSAKSGATGTSAFGSGNNAHVFGQAATAPPASQSLALPTRVKSPDSSPDATPVSSPKPKPTPPALDLPKSPTEPSKPLPNANATATLTAFGTASQSSTTPASSPFKSSAPATGFGAFGGLQSSPSAFKPAEGFGAFGGLKASPSAFKPAEGFGAFGGASPSSSSPFSNSKPASPTSSPFGVKSAFGAGGSGAATPTAASSTPASSTIIPTFGSTSAFGVPAAKQSVFGSSTFGGQTSLPATSPSKPAVASAGGAFSAFSGNSGGFGAFASGAKPSSFSDLLRSKDTDAEKQPPMSAFSESGKVNSKRDDSLSGQPGSSKANTKDLSQSLSLSSISDSSYVDVKPSTDRADHAAGDSDDAEGRTDDEDYDEGGDDDDHSFISASISDDSEPGHGESGDEEEEDDGEGEGEEVRKPNDAQENQEDKLVCDATKIPLPPTPVALTPRPSPSPSPSPKPKVPAIDVEEPSAKSSAPASPATTKAESTTPPGSPQKEEKKELLILIADPSPTPPLSPSSSSPTQPSAVGLGRPTTRPARSSPLAGAPVSVPEDAEKSSPVIQSSQSAPLSLFKPKPASPKKPFGQLPALVAKPPSVHSPAASSSVTPLPPPLVKTPTLMTSLVGAPTMAPATSSLFSLTPTAASPSIFSSGTSSLTPSPTTVPTLTQTPPPLPKLPTGSLPGGPLFPSTPPTGSLPGKPLFPLTPTPGSLPGGSLFPSTPTPGSLPGGSIFASPLPSASAPKSGPLPSLSGPATPSTPKSGPLPALNLFGASPQTAAPTPATPPVPSASAPPAQAGMKTKYVPNSDSALQTEFALLYLTVGQRLEDLEKLAQEAVSFRTKLTKPTGTHSKADLGDRSKWSFADLEKFGKMLRNLEADILEMYNFKATIAHPMQELESNLLKAETRKEEIVRFSRAKADPEFAKMLKVRALGPEHAETQVQLRKQVRSTNDRVEQLEDHLQTCMMKLNEYRTGKPKFKAPSLDTINRTYRNIDIAIEQQAEEIAVLTARIAKLDLSPTSLHTPSQRDKRLPDEIARRPFNVTPSVAASTAAALNAERSAQRLKNALAKMRTQPFINTQAVAAVPTRVLEWSTNVSPPADSFGVGAGSGLPSTPLRTGNLFGGNALGVASSPDWSSSPESAAAYEARRERLPNRTSAHQKSVPLKKSAGQATPVASFDWGPLPGVQPASSLSADVRPGKGKA